MVLLVVIIYKMFVVIVIVIAVIIVSIAIATLLHRTIPSLSLLFSSFLFHQQIMPNLMLRLILFPFNLTSYPFIQIQNTFILFL